MVLTNKRIKQKYEEGFPENYVSPKEGGQFIRKTIYIGFMFFVMWLLAKAIASPSIMPPVALTAEQNKMMQGAAPNSTLHNSQKAHVSELLDQLRVNETLLDGAQLDLKNGKLSKMDMYGIGAMLEVVQGNSVSLQSLWSNADLLSKEDKAYLLKVEGKLKAFQVKAFPQMRLAYHKQLSMTLRLDDVEVELSGTENTILTMVGYMFSLHRNIQSAENEIEDLAMRLRFKKTRYQPADGLKGRQYEFKPVSDNAIASYNGGFRTLEKASVD